MDAPGQADQRVPALEQEHQPPAGDLLGERLHRAAHRREAALGAEHAAQRVVLVRVEPRRDDRPGPAGRPAPPGGTARGRPRPKSASVRPAREGHVHGVPRAGPLARSRGTRRCPDRTGTGAPTGRARRPAPRTTAWVPLPWCTSQSRISTRAAPSVRAASAATAALLMKQNPIIRSGSAWCPGGAPARTRSRACRRAPPPPPPSPRRPPRSAASWVAGEAKVSPSMATCAPARFPNSSSSSGAMHPADLLRTGQPRGPELQGGEPVLLEVLQRPRQPERGLRVPAPRAGAGGTAGWVRTRTGEDTVRKVGTVAHRAARGRPASTTRLLAGRVRESTVPDRSVVRWLRQLGLRNALFGVSSLSLLAVLAAILLYVSHDASLLAAIHRGDEAGVLSQLAAHPAHWRCWWAWWPSRGCSGSGPARPDPAAGARSSWPLGG